MNWYTQNNCRICKKVFCCQKCRETHETTVHEMILFECNICVYGRTFLKNPSDDLMKHINSHHLPLHCLFCTSVFESLDEFLMQRTCQVEHNCIEKNAYTPIQIQIENVDDKYESPPYFSKGQLTASNNCTFSNLATSTPLQREENNLCTKDSQQTTPMDLPENKGEKYECASLQRRVTFCESSMETYEQQNVKQRVSDTSSAVFHSAKYMQDDTIDTNENCESPIPADDKANITGMKRKIELEDTTLWISATNISPTVSEENKEQSTKENFVTPFVAKLRKRQISVVLPRAIRTKNVELSTLLRPYEPENIPVLLTDVESNMPLQTYNASKLSDTSSEAPRGLWTSVSRFVKSVTEVVQGISNATCTKTPLKRCISEDNLTDVPSVKRYKLTEIKCRRPIKDFCPGEYTVQDDETRHSINDICDGVKNMLVDKATQTDF